MQTNRQETISTNSKNSLWTPFESLPNQRKTPKRKIKNESTHDYAARIDHDLLDGLSEGETTDAATTSINSMVNEGLKMVRDRKMQEITAQRKRRNTCSLW